MASIESTVTPRAVAYATLLHLGIVALLALAMLNCARWEDVADFLHLPDAMRSVSCTRAVPLEGPVIEATLVGPAAAPPPPAVKHAAPAAPPRPQPVKIKPEPARVAPIQTLPKPIAQPKLRDQEKVAEIAAQQAEQAKRAQEKEQKQRQAELAKRKAAERILKQLAKVKAESAAQQRQINAEEQKAKQLADLKKSRANQSAPNVPTGKQARTGEAGTSSNAYNAALTNVITSNWLRPFDIQPGTVCPVEIKQVRGGQVTSVKVSPTCPLNKVGKDSVEMAVWRSSPLPYKGFEKDFVPDLTLHFRIPGNQ